MFAHNNEQIDYFRLAVTNSLLAQRNLGLDPSQITIVTDKHSYKYSVKTLGKALVESASNNIVFVKKDIEFKYKNIRSYKDTSHTVQDLPFYNVNRCDVYDISPYDETILVDADYLILSDSLNKCWAHNNELMMNWEYRDAMAERSFDGLDRLSPLGITMYWATVVYFRKSAYTESFFELVKHVRDNKEYYQDLYKWRGGIYRNDHSFSIAAHTMGGFVDKAIPQLPVTLYKTFDTDDIHEANSITDITLFLEKVRSPGDHILTRWRDVDLHVMNKWAIGRISNKLLHLLCENRVNITTHKKKTVRKKAVTKKVSNKKTVKKKAVAKKVSKKKTVKKKATRKVAHV
jgi:hypothetical protein